MKVTYKDAGVDIDKGDALVEKIKGMVKSTYGKRVKAGVGGFACLYEVGDRLLAAGTDGVGTKLKIAQELNIHNTIGIDLVAMCINDILCTGAKPLFFMDYLATGKLDVEVSEQIIEGVVEGCKQSGAALIGGETAEMPGMYVGGEYDLAGFAVGEVYPDDLIDGSKIKEGMSIIGVASSGVHSNGYSLLRKIIKSGETDLQKMSLEPTRIYVKLIQEILKEFKSNIFGLAHITGGGLTNIARLNKQVDYNIETLPSEDEIAPIFKIIKERTGLSSRELYRTFNMGIGFSIITDNGDAVLKSLLSKGEKAWIIGHTSNGKGALLLNGETL